MKRATKTRAKKEPPVDISIHALVKRATVIPRRFVFKQAYFNPRPREEGDKTTCSKSQTVKISIHALVKRATDPLVTAFYEIEFQSTPS